MSLYVLVQGKKMKLYKETLENILYIPIIRVRSIKNQPPLEEFMKDASKVGGASTAGVRKKFLKSEFQLVYEFVNKVVLPRLEKQIIASVFYLFVMEYLIKF